MGAQWKHSGRVANSAKKAAQIGKLVKEIIVSAKMGGPNPAGNSRLAAAIESAKRNSVPRDTLERAIKKGSGQLDDQVTYETITYEGFAPHNVPVIVECLTDNKNRTAADVRILFRKGQLGSIGSVGWMFDRMGMIEATKADKSVDIEEIAIEAGAQNVEPLEKEEIGDDQVGARFYADVKDFDAVTKFLSSSNWTITVAELSYVAKNAVELSEDQKKEVIDFLNAIDDCEDVHRVYTAI